MVRLQIQLLAALPQGALQVIPQEGVGQLAKPAVGRIQVVALVPQQMILLNPGGEGQIAKAQGVLPGELPGDVGRGNCT